MHKVTLGGERLGSGKKMDVKLHGYERSTHDLGYLWRSTMSAGTLVPFMSIVGLPGDTFDIKLNCEILTHPTSGPLFGSYKVQLDIFEAPLRLYHAAMHNNKIGIGLKMQDVKLPYMLLGANPIPEDKENIDSVQVNPSCILHYLGIKGIGNPGDDNGVRVFNAIPLLAYWEIFKNYYSNKQEEEAYVIHTGVEALVETVDSISINAVTITQQGVGAPAGLLVDAYYQVEILYTGATPLLEQILFVIQGGELITADTVLINIDDSTPGVIAGTWNIGLTGWKTVDFWKYMEPRVLVR